MTEAQPLQPGDSVPHFEVTELNGDVFHYSTIWQHRNLVLVTLPECGDHTMYVADLSARRSDFLAGNALCVVTRDRVAGVAAPGVVIADRWGEIVHTTAPDQVETLPSATELLEWVHYIEQRCPECEGEVK